ncbi:hypothetical protein AWC38_SpisGene4694 [Stylophora pistillata]|uniref:Uncharacterized protein n=1 Tax=Stylophora pistillata TaxID=50429 RepID=A0A2B4SQ38_STYPI|nr:hypothetical protein AWC38_SpisGene4694 [Stylophora pistillata]
MNGSILVNGSQRSELVILVKGKRYGPVMASAPANKENVSPEKDIECLSDSFQKSLTMNHVEKDGRYFLDVMEKESERLTRLCQATEQEMASKSLPEDDLCSCDCMSPDTINCLENLPIYVRPFLKVVLSPSKLEAESVPLYASCGLFELIMFSVFSLSSSY